MSLGAFHSHYSSVWNRTTIYRISTVLCLFLFISATTLAQNIEKSKQTSDSYANERNSEAKVSKAQKAPHKSTVTSSVSTSTSGVAITKDIVNPNIANENCFKERYLTAKELSIATGKPSLVSMRSGAKEVPVWSLSGGTVGQSVEGLIPGFPVACAGVRIEIVITTTDKETSSKFTDVYRVHLSQKGKEDTTPVNKVLGTPVRTALSAAPFLPRTILLESYYKVEPNKPITIRIQREPGDPADTFTRPSGLVMVKITPLAPLAKPHVVQDVPGYNSWPVIQALGEKLVCVYSRGSGHTINEGIRAVYARTSSDGGKTWTPETLVTNTPGHGEVTIGKGLDSNGAMLLWVRRIGSKWNHDLYRTTDGIHFTRIATPSFEIVPIQITDVFTVPKVGLMALWFAGNYNDNGPSHSWGTLVSRDNGATWKQNIIESKINKADWPTEQSAVYLGNGRILAVARSEMGSTTTERSQFQMVSLDDGATWKKTRTNIGDVMASTPSLIFNTKTGLLYNYYYFRGRGTLQCRIVKPESVFDHSLAWPDPETVALGSPVTFDAGNVNTTFIKDEHYLAFYSGKGKNTSVMVSSVKISSKSQTVKKSK